MTTKIMTKKQENITQAQEGKCSEYVLCTRLTTTQEAQVSNLHKTKFTLNPW